MAKPLKGFGERLYLEAKSDLFAMFIQRATDFARQHGIAAMITMQSWMFLGTYTRFRERLLSEHAIRSMLHLGPRAFDSISGEVVQTTAFVVQSRSKPTGNGHYFRLLPGKSESAKSEMLRKSLRLKDKNDGIQFEIDQGALIKLPGSPLCYWLSAKLICLFERFSPLSEGCYAGFGIKTGDNPQFMRLWSEVSLRHISFRTRPEGPFESTWYPCTSGGSQRKWYGNGEMVVNYRNAGEAIKLNGDAVGVSYGFNASKYYFREAISWAKLGSGRFFFRYTPPGAAFDGVGLSAFPNDGKRISQILGYLNSEVADHLIAAIAPTLSLTSGDFLKLPDLDNVRESDKATQAISIARADWDNFETSWDFRDLPLLRSGDWEVEPGQSGGPWKGRTLAESWANYAAYCTAAIRRMQELETENNRLWIDAYGLQDELTPEVPEDEITLARADQGKDVAAFLSYAVGCMMGRYSLDQPGLILADAGDTVENYLAKVGKSLDQLQFPPDDDAIIPLLDGEWFTDDVVARTREFLRATFGDDTLEENLRFIEESLGKDLRKYFLTDFYKDHLQTYKKRPIYWLFQSPKKGFGALVYLHRYTKDTINTLLNDYLRDFLRKLESRIEHLEHVQDTASSAREKTAATKEADKLRKTLKECREWERDVLLPLAQQRLEIDLGDGVKANYPKFKGAVAKVAGLS